MALEPREAVAETKPTPSFRHDAPVPGQCRPDRADLALMVSEMIPGQPLTASAGFEPWHVWMQLALATPVVLWGGRPFFERGWASIVNRSLNMFTLIALGTGAAYLFSVAATLLPGVFPASFRGHGGQVEVYYEAGGRDHHAGAARPGARAARAQPHRQRDPRPARTGAADGARRPRGRLRRAKCRSSRCAARRPPARAPGREGAGRRRGARRRELRGRIDAHRRIDAGREDARASA